MGEYLCCPAVPVVRDVYKPFFTLPVSVSAKIKGLQEKKALQVFVCSNRTGYKVASGAVMRRGSPCHGRGS